MPDIDYEELLEIRRVMARNSSNSAFTISRFENKDMKRGNRVAVISKKARESRARIEEIKWKMAHKDDENYLIEIWDA